MTQLSKVLATWGTEAFEYTLKTELEKLDINQLPLQQGLSISSVALDDELSVRIISISDESSFIRAKIGIFYTGVIAGCNCADDPTPVETQNEYCEAQLDINKMTAETTINLLTE